MLPSRRMTSLLYTRLWILGGAATVRRQGGIGMACASGLDAGVHSRSIAIGSGSVVSLEDGRDDALLFWRVGLPGPGIIEELWHGCTWHSCSGYAAQCDTRGVLYIRVHSMCCVDDEMRALEKRAQRAA